MRREELVVGTHRNRGLYSGVGKLGFPEGKEDTVLERGPRGGWMRPRPGREGISL